MLSVMKMMLPTDSSPSKQKVVNNQRLLEWVEKSSSGLLPTQITVDSRKPKRRTCKRKIYPDENLIEDLTPNFKRVRKEKPSKPMSPRKFYVPSEEGETNASNKIFALPSTPESKLSVTSSCFSPEKLEGVYIKRKSAGANTSTMLSDSDSLPSTPVKPETRVITTPTVHKAGTTPTVHKAGTTPTVHKAGTTPTVHEPATTPTVHEPATTPTVHEPATSSPIIHILSCGLDSIVAVGSEKTSVRRFSKLGHRLDGKTHLQLFHESIKHSTKKLGKKSNWSNYRTRFSAYISEDVGECASDTDNGEEQCLHSSHNSTPHNSTPHNPTPRSTTPRSTTSHSATSHNPTPHSTTSRSTTPRSTTPRSTTPHSTTSHNPTTQNSSKPNPTPHKPTSHNPNPAPSHRSVIDSGLMNDMDKSDNTLVDDSPRLVQKKLLPLFSRAARAAASKNRDKKEQLVIDAGLKQFDEAHQCVICRMIYTRGDPDDETLHRQFHTSLVHTLRFTGWKKENVAERADNYRVLYIDYNDPPHCRKKVQALKAILDQELGYVQEEDMLKPNRRVYLYISEERQIKGVCLAEYITHANRLEGDRAGVACVRADVGINRLWVYARYRREGVATKLLDAVRATFGLGVFIERQDVAFSDPTSHGKVFAAKYTGSDNFLIYKPLY